VRATVELAHNLGLKVTAEGVESEAALDVLRGYGCDIAQGYLFSKPQPLMAIMDWLKNSPWRGRAHADAGIGLGGALRPSGPAQPDAAGA